MKKTKTILSIALAMLMVMTTVFSGGAAAQQSFYDEDSAEATRGIIMQPGTDETERNFSWYMSESVTSCSVELSSEPYMTNSTSFEGEVISDRHGSNVAKVTVTGLEKGETYYYTCVSGDEKSEVYSFSTVEADSFSALYMSDIHITLDEETQSVAATADDFAGLLTEVKERYDINMILSAGDQATDGLLEEYKGLSFSPESRSLTFATAIGNHDRKGIAYKYFTNLPNEDEGMISSPQGGNYYFTKGDVLFLVIDSNNASATDHRNFIKKAVAENSELKWRVVMMHHDLYGGTIESREDENDLLRLILSPIFDEFNIDLVLTGHSHHYSVTDVVYNGKSVAGVENGGTVHNAEGTVYMVSASVARPREAEEIPYSELVAIGMDGYADKLYTIIDFSSEAIAVTTYERGSGEEFAGFTLTKDDDFEAPGINFFRKLFGMFTGAIGTVYAVFNNIGRYHDLTEDGFNVDFFETIF